MIYFGLCLPTLSVAISCSLIETRATAQKCFFSTGAASVLLFPYLSDRSAKAAVSGCINVSAWFSGSSTFPSLTSGKFHFMAICMEIASSSSVVNNDFHHHHRHQLLLLLPPHAPAASSCPRIGFGIVCLPLKVECEPVLWQLRSDLRSPPTKSHFTEPQLACSFRQLMKYIYAKNQTKDFAPLSAARISRSFPYTPISPRHITLCYSEHQRNGFRVFCPQNSMHNL